jgi:hypothetical protein
MSQLSGVDMECEGDEDASCPDTGKDSWSRMYLTKQNILRFFYVYKQKQPACVEIPIYIYIIFVYT